jgi:hypothetical protein
MQVIPYTSIEAYDEGSIVNSYSVLLKRALVTMVWIVWCYMILMDTSLR